MALMTPEQFEESLKKQHPRIFMNGKRVENVLENKVKKTLHLKEKEDKRTDDS